MSQTIADYQYSQPDYLNAQFLCEVAGWHNFSKDDQAQMKARQQRHLWELGYVEQPDGSFVKGTPSLTITSAVRVKSPASAFHNQRGTIVAQISPSLWAVRLEGFTGTVDFSTSELTVLN